MSKIHLHIDGRPVTATAGMTLLEAARTAGIAIPTLCHHDKLAPFGACRICLVELEQGGMQRLVVSCAVPAEDGSVVRTRSQRVDGFRKSLLELMLSHAPESPRLQELAREYGADCNRFDNEADFCIHCGLCVRYCAEVKHMNAVGFIDRGVRKQISFIPEIAVRVCGPCKECFPLCPTSYLQAAFVLAQSLAFPSPGQREEWQAAAT
jgi:NADH dehydrogenase/NADH:ubiquinone oxidoreductase subunit G